MKTLEELHAMATQAGCKDARFESQFYSLPDRAYIGRFGKRYADWLWRQGLHWIPDRWDCTQFAWMATAFAMADHALHGTAATALAFGIAKLHRDSPWMSDMVCVAFHAEGPALYSPQPVTIHDVCLREVKLPLPPDLSWQFCFVP